MRLLSLRIVSVLLTWLLPSILWAQCVSLTTVGSAATQNFDTLSNTAGSTTNNLTITGWFLTEAGGGARDNEQYAVDAGGSNTGDVFSYGPAGNTDRALGTLQTGTLIATIGACFTNNTGTTLTNLGIAYTGEQWRIGTTSPRDDRLDFEYSLNATSLITGAWTAVDALDFTNPIKSAVVAGALDGNSAANRTSQNSTVTGLAIANGATFWIRWSDLNATAADDGLAVDDFSLTPQVGAPTPNLSINDVAMAEGDSGATSFAFTVSLSAPAAAGGVSFDIAATDGTATSAADYVPQSLTAQSIPAGSSTYSFSVSVNGDTMVEANESFFVNVTNVVGASVADAQGQGTIQNDDVAITPIHDIQGPGASSPIVGATVTTRGIVTGMRSNGFFLQTTDVEVDADPATSQGILVFTNAAPPAPVAVGNLLQVTGVVTEFVPSQDPLQPPLTELTSPTISLVSAGNPLPSAIALSSSFPSPAGSHDQLERLEGMRVAVSSLVVVAPTTGSINEVNANATSNGVFQGVIAGNARAFREAGIQAPDPSPAGTIPPIPRFDGNPEVIRVDSDNLSGTSAVDVQVGQVVSNLTGPLDYSFRRYTVLPETTLGASGSTTPTAVTTPTTGEVSIASYNLQRFYDTTDDPAISEPILTSVAYQRRLAKASAGIRQYLGMPDIVAVVEMENLAVLTDLAGRISADALAASQPDPLYQPYLIAGNDVGGIDVGFLVKTSPVAAATPRVLVNAVVQERAAALFSNPDSSTETLHDRPPLRLDAVVNNAAGQIWPVTVIVNHLRSMNDIASMVPGSNGWGTVGERVRAKRFAQAADIAALVQSRQLAQPNENIVLVGDFNGFEVNDGLVDLLGTVSGSVVPDNQTAVPGDGIALVDPPLTLMTLLEPAAQRYSYVFDGNAQVLDHALISQAVIGSTLAQRVERARINADFADVERGNANDVRLSDHDPLLLYLPPTAWQATDVAITLSDSPDPVTAGLALTYTVNAANVSGVSASAVSWSIPLPSEVRFQSLLAPAGWTCITPAVGVSGTVTCNVSTLNAGATDTFSLQALVDSGTPGGSSLTCVANISTSSVDGNVSNNSATATSSVDVLADLGVTVADSGDPVNAGTGFTYTLNVTNAGPSDATSASLSFPLPAGTTFAALTNPAGWVCTTPALGANGVVSCTLADFAAGGNATFSVNVEVESTVIGGTVLVATASIAASTADPVSGNNTHTETTGVDSFTDIVLSLSATPDPVVAGEQWTLVATVSNAGPIPAYDVSVNFILPPGTQLASGSVVGGGACVQTGSMGECAFNGSVDVGGANARQATVVLDVAAATAEGSTLSLSAVAITANGDNNTANNVATASTAVVAEANLAVSLLLAPPSVVLGDTVTITASVQNLGPSDAQDVALDIELPPGLQFVATALPGGGSCLQTVGVSTVVSCAWGGPTAPGGTRSVEIESRATSTLSSPIQATGSSPTSDPVGANNVSSTPLVVLGLPVRVPLGGPIGAVLLGLLLIGVGSFVLQRRAV